MMTQSTNANGPYSLLAELEKVKDKGRPPIHLWNPDNVKDIDMEIQANGTWQYLGTPIERPRLVHLFASVLRREGDDYYLVTPVEKCRIRVEDAPFQVVLMAVDNSAGEQSIQFTTNMSETIILGGEHPLRAKTDELAEETAIYVEVRDGLEARLNRNTYYQLVDYMEPEVWEGSNWLGVSSQSEFFPIIKEADL